MNQQIVYYLNPIKRLGKAQYSARFPFLVTLIIFILSEGYAHLIARDPMAVGGYVIFLSVAPIIYFAFRDGIIGGFIATTLTVLYYLYIIYSRHYTSTQLTAGLFNPIDR